MKIMLMKMLVLIPSMIFMLKTPMSLGVLLLIQTLISTLLISKMLSSSWMAFITFLMFIGGLLILFMYMSSIASSEKFTPNIKLISMLIMLIIPMEELISENQINESLILLTPTEPIALTKIYNKKTMLITLTMFLYMFLSMIVVTKIVKVHKGPLRAK